MTSDRLPPPHDTEAERALIAGIFDDPDQIDAIEGDLRPEDMWDNTMRLVLSAVYDCRKANEQTDVATVCRRIRAAAGPEQAHAAVQCLSGLVGTHPFGNSVLGHSEAIRSASQNRKLLSQLERAAGLARLGLGDEARALVDSVSRVDVAEARVLTVREILTASATRAKQDPASVEKYTTLNWELDSFIGGLRRSYTYTIGMFTNCGKSSWMIGVADEMLRSKVGVLIVSFEDTEEIYGDRLLARRALVSADRLRDNELTQDEMDRVDDTIRRAEDSPVFLKAIGRSVEWALPRIKTLVRRHELRCIMIDFIQKVRRESASENERIRMRNTFDDLSDLGKSLGCCTIIASQLTPTNDKPIPDEYSLRECKDMANNSDYIFIGYRPDKDMCQNGEVVVKAGDTVFKVAKAKMGRKKQVVMKWDSESAFFVTERKPEQTYVDGTRVSYKSPVDTTGFRADNDVGYEPLFGLDD